MKKAIFFDVDDTLYDHLIPFRTAVQPWTEQLHAFPYEQAYQRMRFYSDMLSLELGGAGQMEEGDSTNLMRRKRFQLALKEFSIELTEQEAERVQQAYLACQFNIVCYEGAKELLIELQEQGHEVGLLTNGAEAHQWKKIQALGMDKIIPKQRIFISGVYGMDKPDPGIFQLINRETGIAAKQSIYVGDSWRNDVVGANQAGWQVVWFNCRGMKREAGMSLLGEAKNYEELRQYFI
ncbi:HAD family hydrolase [Paenibacillus septentrionalis]|uniref:HAD family hydrolase n=2 Tax=Paenibacillus septentrionalis TaxID=429342 RepID=A0ABW1V757_9BACL